VSVRVRPHHLLCMLTFVGEGYSPAFVANFGRVLERIGAGEPVELVDRPDDICAPLRDTEDAHCVEPAVRRRDEEALRRLTGPGRPFADARPLLDRAAIAALREQFATGAIRSACAGCSWFGLCSDIAAAGYAGVRL